MPNVIRRYQDLLEALHRLPAPSPGYVRVFRGQTADHPTMTPTGLRADLGARDQAWPLYASHVAVELMARAKQPRDYIGDDLELHVFWVKAIKQHYGPGTEFLDVTHSPGIAAWFALHKAETVNAQVVYGKQGAFDPQHDVIGVHHLVRFHPHQDSPGFFYVFDVPEPKAYPDLKHGTLLDLSKAPSAFSSSLRIQVQKACLLYADRDADQGNLASFFVRGTPFQIAWPLEGCPEINLPTEHLFPSVSQDDWYSRFVSLPLAPVIDPAAQTTLFDHPIPIGLYMPDQAQLHLEDLMARIGVIPPALVYADLIKQLKQSKTMISDPVWSRLGGATPIYLEGPLFYILPALGSDLFNLGLLDGDVTPTVPVSDLNTRKITGQAALDNVFIELSLLERTGWERVEQRGNPMETLLRAVWLLRQGSEWLVMLFMQELPDTKMITVGPVRVCYDKKQNAFMMKASDKERKWRPLLDLSVIASPFIKTLSLVRDLSPRWKVAPYPSLAIGIDEGKKYLVPIQYALGDVVSLARLKGPIANYYLLRQRGSGEIFFGGAPPQSPAIGGVLTITTQIPFSQLDPDQVRRQASETIMTLEGRKGS